MRIITLAAAVAALLVPAAPALAGDPTMPLWQVQAGMRCTGYSVIQGTAISSFDVEVLDVAAGEASGVGNILVQVSGPAVDATGVGPGFSGSPIYCPDAAGMSRNIGAISQSVNEYGGKIVLATSIEAILGTPVDVPARAGSNRAGAAAATRGPTASSGTKATAATRARATSRRTNAGRRGARAGGVEPDEGGDGSREAAGGADHGQWAERAARRRADEGGGEGRAPGAGGTARAAGDVRAAGVATRLGGRGGLLERRRPDQLGRDGRLRRRRPGVGLRPRARGQRSARAAASGRLHLPGHQQPAGSWAAGLDVQAGRLGP